MSRSKPGKNPGTPNQPATKAGRYKRFQKILLGTAGLALIGVLVWLPKENQAGGPEVTVYKSPTCGCCSEWVDHMKEAGFKVTTHDRQDMNQIKQEYGVEYNLRSCHTAVVEGYVLEGHIPAGDIKRLLEERPTVDGLAVPGMPMGSPGMEGKHEDPYDVVTFKKGARSTVFARH